MTPTAFIKTPKALWGLFIATIAISAGFQFWTPIAGGTLLDTLATTVAVQAQLSTMSGAEQQAHFMLTALLDMIYPLAYGGLLIGLTLRFTGKPGRWLAVPVLILIPVDWLENIAQLMALSGNDSLLPVKAVLTPLKFTLLPLSAVIALIAVLYGVLTRNKNSS